MSPPAARDSPGRRTPGAAYEGLGGLWAQEATGAVRGGIYHAMSRGNARQHIVIDDRDRQHLVEFIGSQVGRSGWESISFVLLPNHFPLLLLRARGGEVDHDLDDPEPTS